MERFVLPWSFQKFFHTRFLLPEVFIFNNLSLGTIFLMSLLILVSFTIALWRSLVPGLVRQYRIQTYADLCIVWLCMSRLMLTSAVGLKLASIVLLDGPTEFFCWSCAAPATPVTMRGALSQRLSCSQSRAVHTLFRSRSLEHPLIPVCSPLICFAAYLFILGARWLQSAHHLSVESDL